MTTQRSCLVVEDSPTQALALQDLLERNGYDVRVAKNGLDALGKLEDFLPSVVLSDIVMPEMDGLELCRALKADARYQRISVMLLTTLSEPEDVFRALECGADNFVTKPADESQILSRLEYLIANQRVREEDSLHAGLEVKFAGRRQFITSSRLQILNLLLSSYDTAVRKNEELEAASRQLREANETLEAKVSERTEHLEREIERRREAEAKLHKQARLSALLEAAASAANKGETANDVTREVLRITCLLIRWPLGHFYQPRAEDSDELVASDIWYGDDNPNFAPFVRDTQESSFAPGVGLTGSVYKSGTPAWIDAIERSRTFTRSATARECGIQTVVAIPVRFAERVVGVLEFFHTERIEVDMELLNALQQESYHLGRMFEREAAARALADREAFLQSILDHSTAVVYVKDLEGRYVTINRTFEKRFQVKRSEIKGKTDFEIFPQDVANEVVGNDKQVQRSRKPVEIEELVGLENQLRTYLSLKYPLFDRDGNMFAVGGHSLDLTERIKQEELRRLMAEALNQSTSGILLVSKAGEIVLANPAIVAMSQVGLDDLKTVKDLQLGRTESGGQRIQDLWLELASGKVEQHDVELCDRSTRVFSVRTSAVQGEDGMRTHTLFVVRDISAERALERQIQRKHRLESVGTLAGGITHDFNNILAVIQGYTDLAMDDLNDPDAAREDLENVRAAAQRAAVLIQQILRFSRSEAGPRSVLSPNEIVEDILELAQATIRPSVELSSDLDQSCPQVSVDTAQLEQVLLNLITNAAYAIGDVAGRIEVKTENVEIGPDDEYIHPDLTPRRYARIEVSDSGCGMPDETMEKIFDPFFTTKGPDDGTGLGLSNCHAIVRDHEGAITVYSEVDVGTRFHIYLPATEVIAETKSEASGPLAELGGNERILVVDDEEMLALLNKRRLEAKGYRVTAVSRSAEALEKIAAAPKDFDLVISDSSMPVLSGEELAAKAQAVAPDLPFLIISGYTAKFTTKPLTDNVKGYLAKPLPAGQLMSAVRVIVEGGTV